MFSPSSLGAGSLLPPRGRSPVLALLGGFALLGITDTRAACREEATCYFARLRPHQVLLPLASLSILLWTGTRTDANNP